VDTIGAISLSKQRTVSDQGLPTVRTGWTDALIYCRKCARKLDGGFGPDGDLSIRKALRQALRARGQRPATGILAAGCFGVCPKGGVTLMRASEPGRLIVVSGTTLGRVFPAPGSDPEA
jgi:hypothetical protein